MRHGELARAVQVTLGGGLIAWEIERTGTASQWLRDDLQTLLAPYLAGKRGSRATKTTESMRSRSRNRSAPAPKSLKWLEICRPI